MERQLPALKVWKIDWEFIISNYLDKSLWNKKWHLFQYKDIIIDIWLYKIDCEDDTVWFKINTNKSSYWVCETVEYNIKNTSIKILQQQINGAMWRLIKSYEDDLIRDTDGYKQITSYRSEEEDRLREIANKFLDDNGVTNSDIRDAYIDKFVCNNSKLDVMLSNYLSYNRYHHATELMLAFCSATNREDSKKEVLEATKNDLGIAGVMKEVNEFMETLDSEEYNNEMCSELEAI